jgi:hypothetical protein
MVIEPARLVVPVYVATANPATPLPLLVAGPRMTIQDRLLTAVQAHPAGALTWMPLLPPLAGKETLVGEIL